MGGVWMKAGEGRDMNGERAEIEPIKAPRMERQGKAGSMERAYQRSNNPALGAVSLPVLLFRLCIDTPILLDYG